MLQEVAESIAVGFLINVPVGALGILCLKRSLHHGFMAGIISGLGVAVADAIFAGIALLGLTNISALLLQQERWFALGGGLLLLLLGWKTFRLSVSLTQDTTRRPSSLTYFFSSFGIAAAHPMTLLVYLAIFASIALQLDTFTRSAMIGGVFIGSMLWWSVLSGIGRLIPPQAVIRKLVWVNRLSGSALMAFGLWMLWSAITL